MLSNTTIRCRLLGIWLLCAGLVGCNKLLEVEPPPREIDTGSAFNDSASAITAVYGIYNLMVSHGFFEWSGLSYNTARSADDAVYNNAVDLFARNALLYTDADVKVMWEQGFRSLLMINTCLEGLQSATRLSTALHHQLLGEVLFCRAFLNFYLIHCWGDAIPLITTPDVGENQWAKSVPRQQVYEQIIADLLQAQSLLIPAYPVMYKARPNVMAVKALLARVYLYQGRYQEAIAQATAVIESNLYTPLPALTSVFVATGKEAIWQLPPPKNLAGSIEPVGDALLYLGSAVSLTPQLLAAFEPGDRRRQSWVTNNVVYGTTYTTACKYKKTANSAALPAEYYVLLRAAEQYLIRAEANVRLDRSAAAVADLNVVRERAGLTALPVTLTQTQCMAAVEQERRVELFTEWGHRWFDLKRWPGINDATRTRADEVLAPIKSDWQSADQWYPVPRAELQLNPYLVQNPGYPPK